MKKINCIAVLTLTAIALTACAGGPGKGAAANPKKDIFQVANFGQKCYSGGMKTGKTTEAIWYWK